MWIIGLYLCEKTKRLFNEPMNTEYVQINQIEISSNRQVQSILSSYKQPILAMYENGLILDCNSQFLEIYGLKSSDIINQNYFNFFNKTNFSIPGDSLQTLMNSNLNKITVHRVAEKRFLKYLQWTLFTVLTDKNHKILMLLAHDVTPILEVATKEQLLLDSLLDSVPVEIFWKDKSLVYLGCNKSFVKSLGLRDKHDIIGKTDFDLPISKEHSELFRSDDMQVIQSKKPKLDIVENKLDCIGKRNTWRDG